MSATKFSEIRDAWLAVHLIEPPTNASESLLLTDRVKEWLALRKWAANAPMKRLNGLAGKRALQRQRMMASAARTDSSTAPKGASE